MLMANYIFHLWDPKKNIIKAKKIQIIFFKSEYPLRGVFSCNIYFNLYLYGQNELPLSKFPFEGQARLRNELGKLYKTSL